MSNATATIEFKRIHGIPSPSCFGRGNESLYFEIPGKLLKVYIKDDCSLKEKDFKINHTTRATHGTYLLKTCFFLTIPPQGLEVWAQYEIAPTSISEAPKPLPHSIMDQMQQAITHIEKAQKYNSSPHFINMAVDSELRAALFVLTGK